MRNRRFGRSNSLTPEYKCEGNNKCLESNIIKDNGIQEKKNSRLLWFRSQPRLSSGVSIISLPQELIRMILEYLISSEQDLFRFGGVCRSWREMMIVSPLWYRVIHGNPLNLLPQELFTRRRSQIDRWIIQQNEVKKKHYSTNRIRSWLINGAECCFAIAGLAFSEKWKSSLLFCRNIGLISFCFSGLILTFAVMSEEVDQHIPLMLIWLTFFLDMIIGPSPSPRANNRLFRDIVLGPLLIIFFLVTLYWKNCIREMYHSRNRQISSGLYKCFMIVYLSSLFTLALYGSYLENNQQDYFYNLYHFPNLIYFVFLRLLGIQIFFLLYWFRNANGIYQMIRACNSVDYDRKKFVTLLTRSVSCTVGIISVVLMVTQSIPSSVLDEYLNGLFYLLLIGESLKITFFLLSRKGKTKDD